MEKSEVSGMKIRPAPKPQGPTPFKPERKLEFMLSQELIAERAYARYCERGHIHGFDQEDWFLAEQDLRGLVMGAAGAA